VDIVGYDDNVRSDRRPEDHCDVVLDDGDSGADGFGDLIIGRVGPRKGATIAGRGVVA
jgi:hypothetical protein